MRRSVGLLFQFTVRPSEFLPNLALAAELSVRRSAGTYVIKTIANIKINISVIVGL